MKKNDVYLSWDRFGASLVDIRVKAWFGQSEEIFYRSRINFSHPIFCGEIRTLNFNYALLIAQVPCYCVFKDFSSQYIIE